MVFRELTKEDGYTIAELLIALAIISIVLGIVSSVFLFVNRQMNTWNSNMEFYNNFEVVQNKMYNDILSAESITSTDTSLSISDLKSEKLYSWGENVLRYNREKISISEVDSLYFELNNDPLKSELYQWLIRQRADNRLFEQHFIVHLRKPVLWEPLRSINSGEN